MRSFIGRGWCVLRVPGPLHRAVPPLYRAALPVEKTLSVFQGPRPLTLQGWCRASTSLTRCMDEEVCANSPSHPGAMSVDDMCMGICTRCDLVQRVSETDEHVL